MQIVSSIYPDVFFFIPFPRVHYICLYETYTRANRISKDNFLFKVLVSFSFFFFLCNRTEASPSAMIILPWMISGLATSWLRWVWLTGLVVIELGGVDGDGGG